MLTGAKHILTRRSIGKMVLVDRTGSCRKNYHFQFIANLQLLPGVEAEFPVLHVQTLCMLQIGKLGGFRDLHHKEMM